jgi:hypothetical protein
MNSANITMAAMTPAGMAGVYGQRMYSGVADESFTDAVKIIVGWSEG